MLHLITQLIPPPIHRQLYRAAHTMRKIWLRYSLRDLYGCSIIARDGEGRVLLVRHSYGRPVWAFPGGGMNRGEEPLAAALREFAEELRCSITDPQHLGKLDENFHGVRNLAHIFTGLIDGEPRPDMRELVEARFFHRDHLPADVSSTVAKRLALLDAVL